MLDEETRCEECEDEEEQCDACFGYDVRRQGEDCMKRIRQQTFDVTAQNHFNPVCQVKS